MKLRECFYATILMMLAAAWGWASPQTETATGGTKSSSAFDKLRKVESETMKNYNYYFYDAAKDGYNSVRSDILTPKYYVFAGSKTEAEANSLFKELDMLDNVQEWGGQVYFINPLNEKYGDDDREAFIDLVGPVVNNVKVIGIDEGATFANNYLSKSCYFLAGMLIYGGEIAKDQPIGDAVPVYLSRTNAATIDYYKKANGVTETIDEEGYRVYANEQKRPQTVVVASRKEGLAAAFDKAWKSVLSRNYRQHNDVTEFYNANPKKITRDYDLIEVPIFEELGILYHQEINKNVSGMSGNYTWFEYVPKAVEASRDRSVPLVVSLHGNTNDPRLQGDSTGWVELAAKERFIVIAPEWQEKDINFFRCDGLGGDGVINLIKDLEAKYPQIDPSRIYLTGLSIGGAESFLLGLQYSDVFAGVGVVSGVNVFADQIKKIADNYSGGEVPLIYLCGDHDFFQMIPVDGSSKYGTSYLFGDPIWDKDENTHIFSALQAYQKINGLSVSQMNMEANEYYGIQLENQRWIKLGKKDLYTGTLSSENGAIIELAAIKNLAHWNYKPEAEYIWNFFKKYSRDTKTGKLIFSKQ